MLATISVVLSSDDPKVLDEIISTIADSPQFFGQFKQDLFGGDERAALFATIEDKREFVQQQVVVGLLTQYQGIILDAKLKAVQAAQASAEPTAKAKPIAKRKGK